MIVIDANVLIAMVSDTTQADDRARLDWLFEDAHQRREPVGLPTPALAEFLVRTDDATHSAYQLLKRRGNLRTLPFDDKAAVEHSILSRAALAVRNKRAGSRGNWQQVKFDRQIIAIARANNAVQVISGDVALCAVARSLNVQALLISEIPLPEAAKQIPLSYR